ncbi:hypothetical protein B0H15DRAFT_1022536 [Mycena belliarum]|uniref:Uncharacterized protein n=1 Tax=Mycena belliarum TaxID=1033014 RepID=A0AAD6U3G8_9AGAR|nr:hypothetical protein B0H15DRAFT_1022536 [Mycena belliae]
MGETMPVCPEPLNTETMVVRREVFDFNKINLNSSKCPFYRVPRRSPSKIHVDLRFNLSGSAWMDGARGSLRGKLPLPRVPDSLTKPLSAGSWSTLQSRARRPRRNANTSITLEMPELGSIRRVPCCAKRRSIPLARDAELARARRPTPYLEAPREFDASTSPARALSMPST